MNTPGSQAFRIALPLDRQLRTGQQPSSREDGQPGPPDARETGSGGAVTRAIAAGTTHLNYGRQDPDGITFHTLRHTAATLLAELEVADSPH